MAYYLTTYCDGTEGPIIDLGGPAIVSGVYFIDFTGETNSGCYTIGGETTNLPTEGVNSVTSYNNCLECLQDNEFSFYAADCNFPQIQGPISSLYFTEIPFGKFYKLCTPDLDNSEIINCFCLEFVGITPGSFPFPVPVDFTGPFNECGCESPRSANTESTVCVICCPCGATGSTITQVSPPHPVWTDGYGVSVTQLNMITIGGNGLNS